MPTPRLTQLRACSEAITGQASFLEQGYVIPISGRHSWKVLAAWNVARKLSRLPPTTMMRACSSQRMARTSSHLPNVIARYWFGEHPWENPQAYWGRSPVLLAGEIETPTLVLVGTEDHRTPPSEAEQLYQALQLRGVPAALLLIPGASHGGALRPSQDIARLRAALA